MYRFMSWWKKQRLTSIPECLSLSWTKCHIFRQMVQCSVPKFKCHCSHLSTWEKEMDRRVTEVLQILLVRTCPQDTTKKHSVIREPTQCIRSWTHVPQGHALPFLNGCAFCHNEATWLSSSQVLPGHHLDSSPSWSPAVSWPSHELKEQNDTTSLIVGWKARSSKSRCSPLLT